jgi:hypothetical protein
MVSRWTEEVKAKKQGRDNAEQRRIHQQVITTSRVGDSFSDGGYAVVCKLGWGHFSTIWLAKDDKCV